MEVKIRPNIRKANTRWGEAEKQLGNSSVIVNGELAGYVYTGDLPAERDVAGVFHPLANFPKEMCQGVVDNCEALTSYIKPSNKVPEPQEGHIE